MKFFLLDHIMQGLMRSRKLIEAWLNNTTQMYVLHQKEKSPQRGLLSFKRLMRHYLTRFLVECMIMSWAWLILEDLRLKGCRWRIGRTGFQGKCMGKATAWIAATIICPHGEEEQYIHAKLDNLITANYFNILIVSC